MSKDHARLEHLLVRMQSLYGEADPDVVRLREEVRLHRLGEESASAPLRYTGAPPFGGRAERLARVPEVPERWSRASIEI